MGKQISKLQVAQNKTETSISKTNEKIEELGNNTASLYESLQNINDNFNKIKNVPEEFTTKYEKINKIRLQWKQQAEKIEVEYKKTEVKKIGQGAAGVGTGIAVVALGPTAAMGIATTFGVASTGTAISSLSGAAATNAALAWLGGGALATGGGGMAAGNAFLAMAGPVGWAIASVSIITSGILFFKAKANRERIEKVFIRISERDMKSYELAIVELSERIKRMIQETQILNTAVEKIKKFGTDYKKMTEEQQYELGSYYNLMEASTMLLVNPILGLQPKYSEEDFEEFISKQSQFEEEIKIKKSMIMSLTNLLYKIEIDEKDKKLLYKSLKKNKEFLDSIKMNKKDFSIKDINLVQKALEQRYETRKH